MTQDEFPAWEQAAREHASEIWKSPIDGVHYDFRPEGLAAFVKAIQIQGVIIG